VQSLTDAEELLTQVLAIFKDLGFTRELDDQVTYQANYLLREVDKELLRAQLYMMKDGNFSWWNGLRGLAIEAYDVSGPKSRYSTSGRPSSMNSMIMIIKSPEVL